ncbi:MAG: hypothetical protein PHV33_09640 [Elusimicrobiales bacterium]|nr:hypothetical protein [Elusimicrobiales bacterium]
MKKNIFAALLFLVPAFCAAAEAPNLLTYQGRLKEGGLPVTGNRVVEIFLCSTESGLPPCETTQAQPVAVANGLFRSTFTVPGSVDLATGSWWLEIKIEGATLTPRERLTSNSYALYATTAAFAASVLDGSITDAKVATGISASKLTGALPAISGAALTDLPVSGGSVAKIGDTMTGQLTLSASSLTVRGSDIRLDNDAKLSWMPDGEPNDSYLTMHRGSGYFRVIQAANAALSLDNGHLTIAGNIAAGGSGFSVGGSTLVVSAGTVGIGTGTPYAVLDIVSTGTLSDVYAQIWRDGNGDIISSMSATGVLKAAAFVGNGAGLTGVTAGLLADNSVTTAKLADGSVTLAKMGNIADASLLGNNLGMAGPPLELTAAQARTLLGLVPGTDVQVYDADLVTYAGITPSPDIQALLGALNNAAALSGLGGAKSGANSDITSLTGLTTALSVGQGGTGATTLTGVLKGNGAGAFTAMTGTAGKLTRWSNASTIADSVIYDDGSAIGVGAAAPDQKLTVAGNISQTGVLISSGTGDSYFAGNVGVGTPTPGYDLDVNQIIRAYSPSGGNGKIILGDGDIAHGMTSLAQTDTFGLITANSPTGGLHLNGFSSAAGAVGTLLSGVIGSADPTDSVAAVQLEGGKKNDIAEQALGALETVFGVRNYGGGNLLTLLGNGNLGINETVPAYALDVTGTINATAAICISDNCKSDWSSVDNLGNHTATQALDMADKPINRISLASLSGVLVSSGAGNNYFAGSVGVGTSAPVGLFQVSYGPTSTALTVAADGTVILGAESGLSGVRLHSQGGDMILDTGKFVFREGGAHRWWLEPVAAGSGGGLKLYQVYDSLGIAQNQVRVFVSDSGSMGIGSSDPKARLDIVSTGTAANIQAQIWRDSGGVIVSSLSSTGMLSVSSLTTRGRLGIGTAAPRGALDVWNIGGLYLGQTGVVHGVISSDDALELVIDANNTNSNAYLQIKGAGTVLAGFLRTGGMGVGTGDPKAALDVKSTGTVSNVYAQIWRNSGNAVISSMSSTGLLSVGSMTVTGTGRIARRPVEAADAGFTVTAADFGKTFTVNSATPQTITLPAISAENIGAEITVVKLGTGGVIIQAYTFDAISDSTVGGTLANASVAETYATITLRIASLDKWVVIGSTGTWTAT